MVVGTEHYGPLLTRRGEGPATFELYREPTNPHDRNAVAVHLDGQVVGYLSAYQAKQYGSAVERIQQHGTVGIAGRVGRSGAGSVTAWLSLPKPADLTKWVQTTFG